MYNFEFDTKHTKIVSLGEMNAMVVRRHSFYQLTIQIHKILRQVNQYAATKTTPINTITIPTIATSTITTTTTT